MSDDTKFLHARFKDEDGNSIFNMRVTSVPDPGTTIFLTDWHGRRAEYWVLSVYRKSNYAIYDVTVALKDGGID